MWRPLRLRRQSDFQRLRTEGKNWRGPALMISVLQNTLPNNRYGFIVSKRLGKAVVRNRLRRQLREIVREQHSGLRPGHDIVIITKPVCAGLSFSELRQHLIHLLNRASLIG